MGSTEGHKMIKKKKKEEEQEKKDFFLYCTFCSPQISLQIFSRPSAYTCIQKAMSE